MGCSGGLSPAAEVEVHGVAVWLWSGYTWATAMPEQEVDGQHVRWDRYTRDHTPKSQ